MVNGINANLKFTSIHSIGSTNIRQELAEVINDKFFMHLLDVYKKTDSIKI